MDLSQLTADEVMSCLILGAGAFVALLMFLFLALIAGYWMGRNSAEKPLRSKEAKEFDPGPTDEPETGDLFRDALIGEGEKRIATV